MASSLNNNFKHSKLLQDFDIICELGKGAYGAVYKITSKTDKKDYAVKVIKYVNDEVLREINTLSELHHESIVRYHNSWEDILDNFTDLDSSSSSNDLTGSETFEQKHGSEARKLLFIHMEFCPNGTLIDAIEQDLYKDKPRVRALLNQLLSGLEYIHSKKIIHRDLKPSNIFFDDQNRIKIGDFGWSRHKPQEGKKSSSMTSSCGTIPYAAPEVSSQNYDEKVDMYSLGVILFEMCYKFSTKAERADVLTKLRTEEVIIPDDFCKDVFQPELNIIRSLLTHRISERPTAAGVLSIIAPSASKQLTLYLNKPALEQHDTYFKQSLLKIGISTNSLQEYITKSIAKICKKHGGVHFALPLFMPKRDEYCNRNDSLSLVDGVNINMSIPEDLRICFVNWMAQNNIMEMRRFCLAQPVRKEQAEQSITEETECYFDIVQDQRIGVLHQVEIIEVIDKILRDIAPTNKRFKIKIASKETFDIIFSHFGIETQTKLEIIQILSDPGANIEKLRDRLYQTDLESNVIEDLLQLCSENTTTHTKVLSKICEENALFRSKYESVQKLLQHAKNLGIKCRVLYHPFMVANNNSSLYTSVLFQIEYKNSKKCRDLIGSGGCYNFKSTAGTDIYGIGITLNARQIAKCISPQRLFAKTYYIDVVIYADENEFDSNLLRIVWNTGLRCQVRPLKRENNVIKFIIPAGCRWCIVDCNDQVLIWIYDEKKGIHSQVKKNRNEFVEELNRIMAKPFIRNAKNKSAYPKQSVTYSVDLNPEKLI